MKNLSFIREHEVNTIPSKPVWTFQQFDDGVVRLALLNGDSLVPLFGQTFKLFVKKPDDVVVELSNPQNFIVNETNEVDIHLMTNMVDVPGICTCELQVEDFLGEMTIAPFTYAIRPVFGEEASSVIAEDYSDELERLVIDTNNKLAQFTEDIAKMNEMKADIADLKPRVENLIPRVEKNEDDITNINMQLDTKANKNDLTNDRTFKGSDTTSNILLKNDAMGSYYYSTDECIYYLKSESGWINIGYGDNVINAIVKEMTPTDTKDNTYLTYEGVEKPLSTCYTKHYDVEYGQTLLINSGEIGGFMRSYAFFDDDMNLKSIFPSKEMGEIPDWKEYSSDVTVQSGCTKLIVCQGSAKIIPPTENYKKTIFDNKEEILDIKKEQKFLKNNLLANHELNKEEGKYLIYNGNKGVSPNNIYVYGKTTLPKGSKCLITCDCLGLQRAYSLKNLSTGETTVYPNSQAIEIGYTEYKNVSLEVNYDAEIVLSSCTGNISLFSTKKDDEEDESYNKYLLNKVMCIGDSLTRGAYYGHGYNGSHIKEGYPHFLEKMNEWSVTNAGKSGATPISWWDDVKPSIDSQVSATDTFIIWLGTNQGLTDTIENDTSSGDWNSYEETNTGYYCKIIEYIKSKRANANIFLCNVYTTNDVVTTNNVIGKIGVKYGLPVFNMNDGSLWQNEKQDILHPFGNPVHFGKIGNIYLAHKITKYINAYISSNPTQFEEVYMV